MKINFCNGFKENDIDKISNYLIRVLKKLNLFDENFELIIQLKIDDKNDVFEAGGVDPLYKYQSDKNSYILSHFLVKISNNTMKYDFEIKKTICHELLHIQDHILKGNSDEEDIVKRTDELMEII